MEDAVEKKEEQTNFEEKKQQKEKKQSKSTKYSKNNKKEKTLNQDDNAEQEGNLEDNNQGVTINPHNVDQEYIKQADLSQIIKVFNTEVEEEITQGVIYLKTFIKEKKPTFIQLFDIFDKLFSEEENKDLLEKSVERMFSILKCLHSQTANSIIYKTYFTIIQHKSVKIPKDNQQFKVKIPQAWKFVHIDSLSTFLQIFDIKNEVEVKEVDQQVKSFIAEKKFQEAVRTIANFHNYTNELMPQVIAVMCNNKDASKAADIIKQFKLNPADFPEVEIRLKKMSLRYNLRNYSWEFVAELFQDQKDVLAYAVEDLLFNKQYNEAYSILQSDKEILKFVTKKEALEDLNNPSIKFEVIPNKLHKHDHFSPSSENSGAEPEGTHLNLIKDFGITRDKVFFINDVNSKEFELAKQDLESAKQIGLDGEFRPQTTKLDVAPQSLALLQLATQNYCFLFDSVGLKDEEGYQKLLKSIFENPDIIKIGHTISGDISMVASQLKGQLNFRSSLDLAKLHKAKNPEQKQSSLAFIAKLQLGKALCKAEQTSNWSQRPLREAQIHYGALDAYISIALYNKYLNVLGEKEINKFIERC